jgi:hypothetical protein
LFATVAPEKFASQELDASVGASGPHDFAVRFLRHSSKAPPASTASRPASVTIASRPSVGRDANQNIPASIRPSSKILKFRNWSVRRADSVCVIRRSERRAAHAAIASNDGICAGHLIDVTACPARRRPSSAIFGSAGRATVMANKCTVTVIPNRDGPRALAPMAPAAVLLSKLA